METQQYRLITGNRGFAEHQAEHPLQGKDWTTVCELEAQPNRADDSHVIVLTPEGVSLTNLEIAMNNIMTIKSNIEMDMITRRRMGNQAPATPTPAQLASAPSPTPMSPVPVASVTPGAPEPIFEISLSSIGHYPGGNIREVFTNLDELAGTIRLYGIAQPLVVNERDGKYMLIIGERRLRAAGLAGLTTVPCRIKHLSDGDALDLMAIENLQRVDLNKIEEARSYQRLLQAHGTREQVAVRVGKSRIHVTEHLELLDLPADMQHQVATGTISARTGLEFLRRTKGVPEEAKQKAADAVKQERPTARNAGGVIDRELEKAGVVRTTSPQKNAPPQPQTEEPAPETQPTPGTPSTPDAQTTLLPESAPVRPAPVQPEFTYSFETVIHIKGRDFKTALRDLQQRAKSAGLEFGSFGNAWRPGTGEEYTAEEIRKLVNP